MPIVKINNIDCYYEIHGQGNPLVLIAGLASDSQSFHPVMGKLAEHFKVIIFDNRGIGRTRYPNESFQISTLAADTVGLLDELGIENADILGHSMGGCIAQEIAIEYPQRVNRLVLVNTCAVVSQRIKSILNDLLGVLEKEGNYELFIRKFFNLIFAPEYLSDEGNVELAVKYALNYPYPVTIQGFKLQLEALNNFNSLDRLGKIKAKTLLIAGRKDILVTEEDRRSLLGNITSPKIVYLEDAAHCILIDQPDAIAKSVIRFLS